MSQMKQAMQDRWKHAFATEPKMTVTQECVVCWLTVDCEKSKETSKDWKRTSIWVKEEEEEERNGWVEQSGTV
jgi:hypothetical protein